MEAHIPDSEKKRIIVIGGGFAGLHFCKKLRKKLQYQVVLIDVNNYHQFQPLLYQVASSGLEPSSIVFPFRKILQKKKNFHYRYGKVNSIEPENKLLHTTFGQVHYDFLVIATGAKNNFFGNKEIEEKAFPMKSLPEAIDLRNAILTNFEKVTNTNNADEQKRLMTLVIVGAGPTGTELAGAISEMKRFILPKDYPDMDFEKFKIVLVEGSSKVLSSMSDLTSRKAAEYLKKMDVEVLTDRIISSFNGEEATFKNGEVLRCGLLIWAAGVQGNTIEGLHNIVLARGNRIAADSFNQIKGYKNIYAIGDIAFCDHEQKYPNGHPQLAQVAMQQGIRLAQNFSRVKKGKVMKPFEYKNLGSMATVGRNKAVVDLPKRSFSGFFAWLVWMVIHLRSILGVKNKFLVFLNWLYNYFSYNLSLRLIIKKESDVKVEELTDTEKHPGKTK